MNPKMCIIWVFKPTMTHIELIGGSCVDMDDGFGELYCELKVLAMKTEDGFVKKEGKEKGSEVVIHGGVQ